MIDDTEPPTHMPASILESKGITDQYILMHRLFINKNDLNAYKFMLTVNCINPYNALMCSSKANDEIRNKIVFYILKYIGTNESPRVIDNLVYFPGLLATYITNYFDRKQKYNSKYCADDFKIINILLEKNVKCYDKNINILLSINDDNK